MVSACLENITAHCGINMNDWQWDHKSKRWIYIGDSPSSNPTYRWELKKGQYCYNNMFMMNAIEVALQNMETYPDAEEILRKFQK